MKASLVTKAYGFAFPPELLRFAAVAKKHQAALLEVGVRLVGPFRILAGGKPAPDLDRWPADPPELFTVAEGDTDGLHWGYVFHDPGREPAYVGSFYSREGYPVADEGPSLFGAIKRHAEACASDMEDELASTREVGEEDRALARRLEKVRALIGALEPEIPRGGRKVAAKGGVPTLDGLGVRAPRARFDGRELDPSKLAALLRDEKKRAKVLAQAEALIAKKKAGTALQIARDALAVLPTDKQDEAVLLATAAYDALGRPLLARTFAPRLAEIRKRAVTGHRAAVDNRVSHTMDKALADPSKVERLILESWGAQSAPPKLADISKLTNLETLILRGYPLGDLPASLSALAKLTHVELFQCSLTVIPKVLAKLPNLTSLKIVQSLGDERLAPIRVPAGLSLPKLTSVTLAGCGLREVPAFVLGAKKLVMISFSGGALAKLPPQICALTELRYLSVSDSGLVELPPEIGRCKSLTSLWLAENAMTRLPDEIAELSLEHLDVGKNPLTKDKAERARTKKLAPKARISWT